MKRVFFIFGGVVLVLAGGFVYWNWTRLCCEPNPDLDPVTTFSVTSAIDFEIDSGIRIDDASNPRILDYTNGVLTLGYEYEAVELKNAPGEGGYLATSSDGLSFEGHRPFEPGESKGKGLLMPDGSLRRYFPSMDLNTFVSETSTDGGETYVKDPGVRYELDQEGWIGVWTEFVDEEGGVVILFNSNIEDSSVEGGERVLVSRLYSEPDDGLNFTMTHDEVTLVSQSEAFDLGFRDPKVVVLPDGRVRLVVMYQMPPWPPAGRTGTIYTFISEDGASTFTMEGEAVSYDDFTEFEVRSLNDPQILLLDDGRTRIYVAAMLLDETREVGFKWVLVSLTSTE